MTGTFYKYKDKYSASYLGPDMHISIYNREPRVFVEDRFTKINTYAPLTRLQTAKILKAWRKQLIRELLIRKK